MPILIGFSILLMDNISRLYVFFWYFGKNQFSFQFCSDRVVGISFVVDSLLHFLQQLIWKFHPSAKICKRCSMKAEGGQVGSGVVPVVRSGEETRRRIPKTRLTCPHAHGCSTDPDIKQDFLVKQKRWEVRMRKKHREREHVKSESVNRKSETVKAWESKWRDSKKCVVISFNPKHTCQLTPVSCWVPLHLGSPHVKFPNRTWYFKQLQPSGKPLTAAFNMQTLTFCNISDCLKHRRLQWNSSWTLINQTRFGY